MKTISKILITVSFILVTVSSNAQSWTPNGSTLYVDPTTTNVAIGTTSASAKLQVNAPANMDGFRVLLNGSTRLWLHQNGGLSIGNFTTPPERGLYVFGNTGIGMAPGNTPLLVYRASDPTLVVRAGNPTDARVEIGVSSLNGNFILGSRPGDAIIRSLGPTNSVLIAIPNSSQDPSKYIGFGDGANGIWMRIRADRTVRIDGLLYAKEIRVRTNVWSDFVFNSDYRLKSLDEVEAFITKNKHLPGVPNEETVLEEGFNVSEMSAILLQKIEELTLYVIEQNKQITKLEKELNSLIND
jgi:hypothetical protein